mmetsp:Transcript_38605/g.82360  ORF Transcript_38605/g.82360 Transcript_38605/m.82360 type:complete len:91 (-) Transcript_38605:159-431(-)
MTTLRRICSTRDHAEGITLCYCEAITGFTSMPALVTARGYHWMRLKHQLIGNQLLDESGNKKSNAFLSPPGWRAFLTNSTNNNPVLLAAQ